MKKLLILIISFVFTQNAFCKIQPQHYYIIHINQQDTLAMYTGKYQSVQRVNTFYVDVALVNGELVATSEWDGNKLLFKHLSGDNFIVTGLDWSIKFIRDKDKKIVQMLVRGTDYWTKVKQ